MAMITSTVFKGKLTAEVHRQFFKYVTNDQQGIFPSIYQELVFTAGDGAINGGMCIINNRLHYILDGDNVLIPMANSGYYTIFVEYSNVTKKAKINWLYNASASLDYPTENATNKYIPLYKVTSAGAGNYIKTSDDRIFIDEIGTGTGNGGGGSETDGGGIIYEIDAEYNDAIYSGGDFLDDRNLFDKIMQTEMTRIAGLFTDKVPTVHYQVQNLPNLKKSLANINCTCSFLELTVDSKNISNSSIKIGNASTNKSGIIGVNQTGVSRSFIVAQKINTFEDDLDFYLNNEEILNKFSSTKEPITIENISNYKEKICYYYVFNLMSKEEKELYKVKSFADIKEGDVIDWSGSGLKDTVNSGSTLTIDALANCFIYPEELGYLEAKIATAIKDLSYNTKESAGQTLLINGTYLKTFAGTTGVYVCNSTPDVSFNVGANYKIDDPVSQTVLYDIYSNDTNYDFNLHALYGTIL